MKRKLLFSTALLLSGTAISAKAESPPEPQVPLVVSEGSPMEDLVLQHVDFPEGIVRMIEYTYVGPPGCDIDALTEKSIEKGGLSFARTEITQEKNYRTDHQNARRSIAVAHETEDEALAAFPAKLDYSEDGFTGQLTLETDTIITSPGEKERTSYPLTEKRDFQGLGRNDPYLIPKVAQKNGAELSLTGITWKLRGDGKYDASASYAGQVSGLQVLSYISTGTYSGEVEKTAVDTVTYHVFYEEAGPASTLSSRTDSPPFPEATSETLTSEDDQRGGIPQIILLVIGFVTVAVTSGLLILYRNNYRVYVKEADGEWRPAMRGRIAPSAPVIDLRKYELPQGGIRITGLC